MRQTKRWIPVAAIFVVAVTVGTLAGIALRLGGEPAEADRANVQSPATTPTPAEPGTPSDPPTRPAADVTFEPHEELAGTTVVVLGTTYAYSPDSPDQNNGETLFSEKWVRLGSDGRPIESFGRYTTEDGTVVQTVHQTTEMIDIRFREPQQRLPDGTARCGIVSSSPAQQMLAHQPPFASVSAFSEAGYRAGGENRDLPAHPGPSALPNGPAIGTYPATTPPAVLSADDSLADGRSRTRTAVIDPESGLVLEATSVVRLPSGEIDQESVLSVTRVDVYDSVDVPDSMLDRNDLPGGEC